MLPSWTDTQITHIKLFIRIFVKLILSLFFYKIHDEKCSFLPFSTARVKGSIWNQHILVTHCSTLTLSTGERSFGHFTSSRCYNSTIFNFAYMNSPCSLERDSESRLNRNRFQTKNYNCVKLMPIAKRTSMPQMGTVGPEIGSPTS